MALRPSDRGHLARGIAGKKQQGSRAWSCKKRFEAADPQLFAASPALYIETYCVNSRDSRIISVTHAGKIKLALQASNSFAHAAWVMTSAVPPGTP